MAIANPYEKYRSQSIYTATKEELTLMLYEGALKFCNQGLAAIEAKEYQKANELILKVEAIVREFQLTLNRGFEVSKQLDPLYDYLHEKLFEANMKKDTAALTECRDLLREFRDMWKEAMKLARMQKPPEADD